MHVILRGIDPGAIFFGDYCRRFSARIRESVNGDFVLGNARFEREIAATLGRRTWRGSPGRPKKSAPYDRQVELAA